MQQGRSATAPRPCPFKPALRSRADEPPWPAFRLRRHLAEIVALADRHADMADDVVGGRAVELHLQHREMVEIVLRREIARLAADCDRDLRVILAVELIGP